MKRSVEWKVEQREDGGYYLFERETGGLRWDSVRRRGLFGNRDKTQFQHTLSAYEKRLEQMGVIIAVEQWPDTAD